MIGAGVITVLCIGSATFCTNLEFAALEAIDWWAAIEPRAELTATIGLPTDPGDWHFTLYLTEEQSGAWHGGPMRINPDRPIFTLSRVIAHEMGHVFGAVDEYPECRYGFTIMCSTLAYHYNRISDETRERIGWGEFPVYRMYLPIATG